MTWKDYPSFGMFKELKDGELNPNRKNMIQILIQRKDYLNWCYKNNMHNTNADIKWLWDNLKEKERELVINYKLPYQAEEFE